MSKDKKMNMPEPDPREALLPWYATGKLDDKERASVEAWLEENPQGRAQLDLIGEEIDATLMSGDAIDPPSARMLDRLMADIDEAEGPQRAGGGVLRRMIEGLTGFLPAGSPMGLRMAGIAAALVICVQAAALGWMLTGAPTPGYQTASGPGGTVVAGPSALIAFQDNARAADIAQLLDKAGAVFVEGPREGGIFVIRFKSANMSDEDAAAAIAALGAQSEIVRFAAQAR